MKRLIWMTAMVAGGVSLCAAQDTTKTEATNEGTGAELAQEAVPWRIEGGLLYKNWLYEHDALQQRAPTATHGASDWENGNTSGSGAGLQTRIGRGDGTFDVAFTKSDFK